MGRPGIAGRAADGGLEVSLEEFRTSKAARQTDCVFHIRENNRETSAWKLIQLEVLDATGNHWSVNQGNDDQADVKDGILKTVFSGALWPGESAWKIRGEFKRVKEFPKNELLQLPKISIPDGREASEPRTRSTCNGADVELAAIIPAEWDREAIMLAGGVTREDRLGRARLLNADCMRGCVTVVLDGEILSRHRRLTFVSAVDEQGEASTHRTTRAWNHRRHACARALLVHPASAWRRARSESHRGSLWD